MLLQAHQWAFRSPFGNLRTLKLHSTVSLRLRSNRRANPLPTGIFAKAAVHHASRGLSSEPTISTTRTAVCSACCLPERRVANRLQQLCSSNPRFPPAILRSLCEIGQIVLKQEPSECFSCFLLPFEAKKRIAPFSLSKKRLLSAVSFSLSKKVANRGLF